MIHLPKPALQRVEICWDDATAGSGRWVEPGEVKAMARATTSIVTLGYLVRVTANEVTIAGSRVDLAREEPENERWGGLFTIPRSTIRKVVRR